MSIKSPPGAVCGFFVDLFSLSEEAKRQIVDYELLCEYPHISRDEFEEVRGSDVWRGVSSTPRESLPTYKSALGPKAIMVVTGDCKLTKGYMTSTKAYQVSKI
ncbi:uncharacterized protein RSE6_14508 [Rhynchosporium secalis]|uniref:Uncharacterized protein n=1 Tax=Rhynchosporium secalis TaxID=38038 RepID=A0A1E1MVJ4_RHYSE|nr:uncharacterized protein RSE6_14508 [Rhynchosporium secalis]